MWKNHLMNTTHRLYIYVSIKILVPPVNDSAKLELERNVSQTTLAVTFVYVVSVLFHKRKRELHREILCNNGNVIKTN